MTASLLRKRLSRAHRVVLVEREAQHVFSPSLLWLMVGARREREITRPLAACFIETGNSRAGFGSGNFFAEPAPRIRLRQPGMLLHLGKIAYEKYWLYRWL